MPLSIFRTLFLFLALATGAGYGTVVAQFQLDAQGQASLPQLSPKGSNFPVQFDISLNLPQEVQGPVPISLVIVLPSVPGSQAVVDQMTSILAQVPRYLGPGDRVSMVQTGYKKLTIWDDLTAADSVRMRQDLRRIKVDNGKVYDTHWKKIVSLFTLPNAARHVMVMDLGPVPPADLYYNPYNPIHKELESAMESADFSASFFTLDSTGNAAIAFHQSLFTGGLWHQSSWEHLPRDMRNDLEARRRTGLNRYMVVVDLGKLGQSHFGYPIFMYDTYFLRKVSIPVPIGIEGNVSLPVWFTWTEAAKNELVGVRLLRIHQSMVEQELIEEAGLRIPIAASAEAYQLQPHASHAAAISELLGIKARITVMNDQLVSPKEWRATWIKQEEDLWKLSRELGHPRALMDQLKLLEAIAAPGTTMETEAYNHQHLREAYWSFYQLFRPNSLSGSQN